MIEYERYKGQNIIVLRRGEGERTFSFGYKKARLIVDHIEEIKAFVKQEEENEKGYSEGKVY